MTELNKIHDFLNKHQYRPASSQELLDLINKNFNTTVESKLDSIRSRGRVVWVCECGAFTFFDPNDSMVII